MSDERVIEGFTKRLDPQKKFDELSGGVIKEIKAYFPGGELKGKRNSIRLKEIKVVDNLDNDDLRKQKEIKEKEGSWSVPVRATLELFDNETGKVIDNKTMTLARIPKMTSRFSYLVNGLEKHVDYQSQLKDGIYTRVADNGVLESVINTAKPNGSRERFKINFDPQSSKHTLSYGTTNLPLYGVLKVLGVPDEKIEGQWGSQILESNKGGSVDALTKRMYQRIFRKDPADLTQAQKDLQKHFSDLSLDPVITKITTDTAHEAADGHALLSASKALLDVNRGQRDPSTYDDLRFKKILHVEDHVPERIRLSSKAILGKVKYNIDRADKVDRVVTRELFDKPISSFFGVGQLASLSEQTNPLAMLTGQSKHTLMGEGGISTAHQVSQDAKIVHPSSIGFLDPLHTPESASTGVNLQIPLGSWKEGKDLVTEAFNTKTKKFEKVTSAQLAGSNLGFPDEFKTLQAGKPAVPTSKRVRIVDGQGKTREVGANEVDYILPSHTSMFSATTNMIPFLQSNNGNRVGYADSHAHQALGLLKREPPMVQAAFKSENPEKASPSNSMEYAVGKMFSTNARVDGVVTQVTKDHIFVKDKDGKTTKHPMYDHYPLNNKKGFLTSEPIVKAGQEVKAGQTLADTNFSRGGFLSLGRNMRVAYAVADGMNFEDGLRISESAAQEFSSEHLYKKTMDSDRNTHFGTKKYWAHYPTMFKKEQLDTLTPEGFVKPGQRVKPGDPLVLAVKKDDVSSEASALSRISKGLVKPWKDSSIVWDGDHEGVVTDVVRHGNKVRVHVKTLEPAEVGDKIVGRHGNKGIITDIRPDHEMPHYVDQVTNEKVPVQVLMNPIGVPGRINPGQLLETSASLIARKTGKPFRIKSFDPSIDDYTDYVEKSLDKHGIKPTVKLVDPKTGDETRGEVHAGYQYMYKLDQQVSKKLSARSGGAGNPYDLNKAPTTGGGKLGGLGTFGLLAHGAVHNLREMQVYKSQANDEVWRAVHRGDPIPAPQVPYAYEKFTGFMKGLGVNVNKEGNNLVLEPLTDKQVSSFSNGEVLAPGKLLRAKDLAAEKGGLFDPKVFGADEGGLKGGKWGHIKLDAPIPNPIFEGAIVDLLGMKQKDYNDVIQGKRDIQDGTGPQAIVKALEKINVKEKLEQTKRQLEAAKGSELDKLNRQVRYLQNLERLNTTPREAYTRQLVPVLPPLMRPISAMQDGSLNTDDLNNLYKGVGLINHQLKNMDPDLKAIPQTRVPLEAELYDGLKALAGVGTLPAFHFAKKEGLQGLMGKLEGKSVEGRGSPKTGFFQKHLMARKQDMSMRTTIVPDQSIKLDEVALPRVGATQIFEPHIIQDLRRAGLTTLQAKAAIREGDPRVNKALERVVANIPVLMKRDPVLHKFGTQAFKVKVTEGKAIGIHPLVTGGFNADFDGNCVLGDSKIVLTFLVEEVISVLEPLVKEDSEMKFLYDSIVMGAVDGSRMVEMEIQQVPYNKAVFTLDKNGAKVHPVLVPFYVYSYDATTGEESFEPVTHVTVEEGCEVFRVETAKGWYVDASGNESLAVFDHDAGGMVRSPATEESIGKFCAILPPVELTGGLSFDEGWAIGSFVSDGFFMGGPRVGYAKLSEAHREKMASILQPTGRTTYHHGNENAFGDGAKDHYKSLPDQWVALFSSCYAEGEEGRAALRKRLPPSWRTMSSEGRWGLLSGLLDGDGSLSISSAGRFTVQVSTSSPYLVEDVIALCQSLGVRASSSSYKAQSSGNTAYIINLSVVDIRANADRVVLVNPEKADNLRKMMGREMVDDRDQIPVTEREMHLLISLEGVDPKSKKSLQTILSKKRGAWALQRSVVQQRLSEAESLPEELRSLKARAYSDVRWDRISAVQERGHHTVYDLVVPTTKVFAVNHGLVVWDTMAVYAPLTKDAIEEAHKMLPSNNLFSPTRGELAYTPSNEAQTGIFQLSRLGAKTNHSFRTEQEALQAYQKKVVDFDDQIRVEGKTTSVGRLMLDQSLPPQLRGMIKHTSEPLNKKQVGKILTEVARTDAAHFGTTADAFKNLGNATAVKTGLSISLSDIKANKEKRKAFFDPLRRQEDVIRRTKLPEQTKDNLIIELYKKNLKKFDATMEDELRRKGSVLMEMMDSGGVSATKGWAGTKQLTGAPVMFEDAKGQPVPTPVLRSFSEGLRMADMFTSSHGVRMGTLAKTQGTSVPGALGKRVTLSMIDQMVEKEDCGTKKGASLSTEEADVLDRYLSSDVVLKGGKVISKGTLVTPSVLDKIKSGGVSKIPVRSPLGCASHGGVCQKCAGLSESGQPVEIGTNLGVIAAQSLSEPTTQMSMRMFHCNHPDSLVQVMWRVGGELVHPRLWTMEEFYAYCEQHPQWHVEVAEDEEVWRNDGDPIEVLDGDGLYTPVTHCRRHAPFAEMVFVGVGMAAAICQENHPLMVSAKSVTCTSCGHHRLKRSGARGRCARCSRQQEWQEPCWRDAEMCEASEIIQRRDGVRMLISSVEQTNPADLEIPGYAVGMFLAEGCVDVRSSRAGGEKRPYTVVVAQEDGAIKDKLVSTLLPVYHLRVDSARVCIHDLKLGERFLTLFRRYSHKKKLPGDLTEYSNEYLAEVLCGYIDGDGCVTQTKKYAQRISCETTSFALAQQILYIGHRLGIHVSLSQATLRGNSAHQAFVLRLSPTRELRDRWLSGSLKARRMGEFPTPAAGESILPVTSLKETLFTEDLVYDLTTASGTLMVGFLHHHNTGGILEPGKKNIYSGFGVLDDLMKAKATVRGSAKLAPVTGKVQRIAPDPAGGFRVSVKGKDGKEENVWAPKLREDLKAGMTVEAGDPLSPGLLNPHEILQHKGLSKAQEVLASQLNDQYGNVRRRHIEMAVRAMTSLGKVTNAGDVPGLLKGDVVNVMQVREMNRNLPQNAKPAQFRPTIKGVNRLPLDKPTDWATKMALSHIKDTVIEGALKGERSDIHGTSPIPGLIYGKEFGTNKKSGRPY